MKYFLKVEKITNMRKSHITLLFYLIVFEQTHACFTYALWNHDLGKSFRDNIAWPVQPHRKSFVAGGENAGPYRPLQLQESDHRKGTKSYNNCSLSVDLFTNCLVSLASESLTSTMDGNLTEGFRKVWESRENLLIPVHPDLERSFEIIFKHGQSFG